MGLTVVCALFAWSVLGLFLIICFLMYYADAIADFCDDVREKWSNMLRWGYRKPTPRPTKKVLWTNSAKNRAFDQMHALIREIVKANFCRDALDIYVFTLDVYKKKLEALQTIERLYPELRLDYSPTRISWFSEVVARKVFGKTDWDTIKRTLWLVKESNGLRDLPPEIVFPKVQQI